MKRIVFFGSIGLAKKCLEDIVLKEDIELLGVCCEPKLSGWRSGQESVYSYCESNGIPILTFEEVKDLSPDIGISVRYNRIIPESVINCFKQGIFNTHGGILPEYRGSYCNINAIINGEEKYGVTLHYIANGVDVGDIVAVKKAEITSDDTGFSLYKKSEQLCYDILKENIDDILNNTNEKISQGSMIQSGHETNTYSAKNTLNKKSIKFDNIEDSINIIKAFDSPYHEPAYTFIRGQKVYLRINYGINDADK